MFRFKRLLSVLLAVLMCLGAMPITGFATTTDGFDNFANRNTFNSDIFTDVSESDWFYADVKAVYELGLMLGKSANTFDTESGVTIAEAITIAARIHSIYTNGSDAFEAGTPWYQVYVDYAAKEGIFTEEVKDFAKPATRAEFVTVLANAMPDEALETINKVAADAIPDVKADAAYGEAVYKLYRAGIMTGNDEKGTFAPDSEIKRSEVAAVTARMANKDLRKTVKLGEEYTVTFDMNGHGEKIDDQTIFEGETAEKPENPAKDNSYVFKGWYTEKDGGKEYDFKTPVTEDITLYARWEKDNKIMAMMLALIGGGKNEEVTFTVAFDSNGGTAVESQEVKAGKLAVEPTAPTKDGFAFAGWYSDEELTTAYDFATPVTADIVLYAKWRVISSTEQIVPDEIAELFGVDPDDYDTDDDGLSNYIEIYVTGTEPTLVDSDENGILDADEDADEDGLANIEEIELGTDLAKKDTDGDGLSDFEEAKTHDTDPLAYDTDEDGLSDGDEIYLGLNPLVQKTNGETLDSERIFTQVLSEDNISEELLSEDNEAVPTLTLNASGNINNDVVIEPTKSNSFSDSRAIVGEAIDISGENITEGTISFALKEDGVSMLTLDDKSDSYSTSLICKYDEEGATEYLDTDYDESTNTLSASIDGDGTYFVLDVKNLFDELGLVLPSVSSISTFVEIEPVVYMAPSTVVEGELGSDNGVAPVTYFAPDIDLSSVAIASADTVKVTTASSGVRAQADIVFIVDTTGSMGDEIYNVKNNISYFVDALNEKGISAALALIDYEDITVDGYDSTRVHKNGSSNWFYDVNDYKTAISNLYLGYGGDEPECAVDALETARLLDMRASAGKIFVLVTDADYKVANRYGIPSMPAEIELLKNAGVSCSVVSPNSYKSTYYDLYTETDGMWANIYGDFYEELMALADKIGSDIVGDGYWIYLNGPIPVPVRLDAKPEEGSDVDTDKDGIPDIKELEGATPTKYIDLDELVTKMSHGVITDTDYGMVMMYEYESSPIEKDTDFDGIADDEDVRPNNNHFKGVTNRLKNNSITASGKISFTVDYRNFFKDNKTYNKDISVLSSLFAADIYEGKNGVYIEVTDGATLNGNHTPNSLFTLFGMNTVSLLPIGSDNDRTDIVIGNRVVEYNGTKKNIVLLSVRGTNGTFEEWSSNFDVGADTIEYYSLTGYHSEWINKDNHKGFDVTSNRIKTVVDEYINEHTDSTIPTVLWITGHSRGAGIANILGAMYEDEAKFSTYTYTFAAPNTTTSTTSSSYKYNSIFNIVNSDDMIPTLPLEAWGFRKYGITKSISVEAAGYEDKNAVLNRVGTFEHLLGMDYNNNSKIDKTLEAFKKIANSREDLYVFTYEDDTLQLHNINHLTEEKAEDDIEKLEDDINETMRQYCQFEVITGKNIWGQTVHRAGNYQTPAYFMQVLALIAAKSGDGMTSAIGTLAGNSVAKKYESARNKFALIGNDFTGGMNHPHWTETYYLIASNNFVTLH